MLPDVAPPEIKIYGSRLRVLRSHAHVVLRSSFHFSLRIFEQFKRETARSLLISLKGQNMEFTANMLLTCILYYDAESGCD